MVPLVEEAEKTFIDMTSAEVVGLLFKHWFFDESFVLTMKYFDEPHNAPSHVQTYIDALKVVRKAVNVKEQLSDSSIAEAAQMVKELGLNEDRFIHTAKRLQEK